MEKYPICADLGSMPFPILTTVDSSVGTGETGTLFLQVSPRSAGSPSFLSAFLTGGRVFDPVTGGVRFFSDLSRRQRDLEAVVCAAPAEALQSPSLRLGVSRVH